MFVHTAFLFCVGDVCRGAPLPAVRDGMPVSIAAERWEFFPPLGLSRPPFIFTGGFGLISNSLLIEIVGY